MLKTQNKLLNDAYLVPDQWLAGEKIVRDRSGFSDNSFPGCDYRINNGYPMFYDLAINLEITGRRSHAIEYDRYKTRVKVEFVGDGEQSQFSGGWIYTDFPLN